MTLKLDNYLPQGRREPADIAAALEVAGSTRIALVAAIVTGEDQRLTFTARGDDHAAKLLEEAVGRLKAWAIEAWNTIAALKALDPDWTAERDKALDARLETMASDAEAARFMLDLAVVQLKLALSESLLQRAEATDAA